MVTRLLSHGACVNSQVNSQFQMDPSTTTGLTFGYDAGQFSNGVVEIEVSAGTIALADDTTSIITVNNAGGVNTFPVGSEAGNMLYKVTTVSSAITAVEDLRNTYL